MARSPFRLERPAVEELPAILLAVLGALVPLGWHLAAGTVPFEDDLQNYFRPVMTAVSDRLRSGELPLWTNAIFTGFPLFADSEAGTLYPVNWIMVAVPGAAGLRLIIGMATAIAALGMYRFLRRLGMRGAPCVMGAWAFSLGGFVTGNQIHVSLLNGASLLPWVLEALEAAVGSSGRQSARWLVIAGMLHALQWLAGHAQAPVLTWLLSGAYLVYRLSIGRDRTGGERRRGAGLHRLISYPAAIGLSAFGLAAVQLLPSIELASQSARASRMDYGFAASYAVSPFDLVSLIFPFFFQAQDGVRWSLWALWETSGYPGVVPLALAFVGAGMALRRLAAGRSRDDRSHARFFLLCAIVSLWLAMSPNLPVDLHRLLYGFPIFDRLRAPARYLLLFDFAMGVLAAYGASAVLTERAVVGSASGRHLAMTAITTGATVLGSLFVTAGWIGANRDPTIRWLDEVYATMQQSGLLLSPERLFDFLQWSVWLGNPRVAFGTTMILACVLLLAMRATGRLSAARAQRVALVLALADLSVYAATFWQSVPMQNADAMADAERLNKVRGSGRLYVAANQGTQSDQFMPFEIAVIGGYSSYAMKRQGETLAAIDAGNNLPLDWSSVEYVLPPARSFVTNADGQRQEVQIDRPISIIEVGTAPRDRRFLGRKPLQGVVLRMVSALEHAADVPQGTVVAYVIFRDAQGRASKVPIRAGIETAEWALDRDDVLPTAAHRKAMIYSRHLTADMHGGSYYRYLYSATVEVPEGSSGREVELEATAEGVRWRVFRLQTGESEFFDRFDLERFSTVLDDAGQRIVRNLAALPRLHVAAEARVTTPQQALRQMLKTSNDAGREVLLDDAMPFEAPEREDRWSAACGETAPYECAAVYVTLTSDKPELAVAKTRTPADGWLVLADSWYPGWTATVDGRATEIRRANYVQRAVALPAGEHTVEFAFRPLTVRAGAIITAISMVAALGALWELRGRGARASS